MQSTLMGQSCIQIFFLFQDPIYIERLFIVKSFTNYITWFNIYSISSLSRLVEIQHIHLNIYMNYNLYQSDLSCNYFLSWDITSIIAKTRSQYPHRLYIFNFKGKIVFIIEILNYNENDAASGWYSFWVQIELKDWFLFIIKSVLA